MGKCILWLPLCKKAWYTIWTFSFIYNGTEYKVSLEINYFHLEYIFLTCLSVSIIFLTFFPVTDTTFSLVIFKRNCDAFLLLEGRSQICCRAKCHHLLHEVPVVPHVPGWNWPSINRLTGWSWLCLLNSTGHWVDYLSMNEYEATTLVVLTRAFLPDLSSSKKTPSTAHCWLVGCVILPSSFCKHDH